MMSANWNLVSPPTSKCHKRHTPTTALTDTLLRHHAEETVGSILPTVSDFP